MPQDYQHYKATHQALHDRCFPHRLMAGVWMWSVYSEEKEMDFNGYLVETIPGQGFIVDPPCGGPEVLEAFVSLPRASCVILTNRDHERSSELFRKHFNIPVYAPDKDAPLLEHAPDQTYRDGESLIGGWQAFQLNDQKSPGECVLYHAEHRIVILGDALIGKSTFHLSMLPAEKYHSKRDALQGLQRLRSLDVKTVLCCDGDPVLQNGSAIIAEALLEAGRELEERMKQDAF